MVRNYKAFSNGVLIQDGISVDRVDVAADFFGDVYSGTAGSTVYVIEDGVNGDDSFANFETWDSLVTQRAIFDEDSDGYIFFGLNEVLEIDRIDALTDGDDHFTFTGDMRGVRYLGTKGDRQHVYADADVRLSLEAFLGRSVIEGTVGNDVLDASADSTIYFYDNALGLNLGGDTISGFGRNDYIVTTVKLYDGNGDGIIGFGKKAMLDLAGGVDPTRGGADIDAAGQIKFVASSAKQLHLQDEIHVDVHGIDTVYFIYAGTANSDHLV